MPLKVLSYNIHKGFSAGRRRQFVLRQIGQALQSVSPDLVFLQEVIGKHAEFEQVIEGWPAGPQSVLLAGATWPYHVYAGNAVYRAGHHGNAVLSKFPLLESTNVDLSLSRVEKRGLLQTTFVDPDTGEKVHSFCTHLDLVQRNRRKQLLKVCRHIAATVSDDAPIILAGDFNDWTNKASPILREQLGLGEVFHHCQGRHARTFPSRLPMLRLDRIYVRGFDVINPCIPADLPWHRLSDHTPIAAELALPETKELSLPKTRDEEEWVLA